MHFANKIWILAACLTLLGGLNALGAVSVTGTYTISSGEGDGIGSDEITIANTSTLSYDNEGAGGGTLNSISIVLQSASKDDVTLNTVNGTWTVSEAGGTVTIHSTGGTLTDGANASITMIDAITSYNISHQDANGAAANVHTFDTNGLTLTVVPEPHEYAFMAGMGLLGFAVWRRRQSLAT